MDRQVMETDIVVTGFGPASAGFLLTLAPELAKTKEEDRKSTRLNSSHH